MYGTASRTTHRRPAWKWLYAVLPLALAVFGLVEALEVTGPARLVLQLLATLVVFSAMALWVRGNRTALEMAGAREIRRGRRSLEHPASLPGTPARRRRLRALQAPRRPAEPGRPRSQRAETR
jgi:hypothetical protein